MDPCTALHPDRQTQWCQRREDDFLGCETAFADLKSRDCIAFHFDVVNGSDLQRTTCRDKMIAARLDIGTGVRNATVVLAPSGHLRAQSNRLGMQGNGVTISTALISGREVELKDKSMTIDVLYIAGSGRTGSTFLSMLLSQNDDAHNVGQIRDLPASTRRNVPCSCGAELSKCEFWTGVTSTLKNPRALPRLIKGFTEFRKEAREDMNWNKQRVRNRLARRHKKYLENLRELFTATSEKVGAGKMLVDSSKSPEQALALALIPEIKLYALNLTRDPRAVTISWAKRNDDVAFLKGRAKEWRKRQRLMGYFEGFEGTEFKLLRYEDLTADPRGTIENVLKWTGHNASTENFSAADAASVTWDDLHLFAPINEGVLKARATDITIKPADSWKDIKNKDIHAMATDIVFPAAEKYGYSRDF